MMNALQHWPYYRDTWGSYDSAIMPLFAGLDHNSCYRPKWYNAPDIGLQLMQPGVYQRYTLSITPGSLIWGWIQNNNSPIFSFQLTDMSTGHQFWDTPISNYFLSNPNGRFPSLLSAPYPVVGNGMFRAELWADAANTGAQRCYVILGVAEVVQCP
jgi:hypothetical protein